MKPVSLLPPKPDGHVELALPWYVNGTLGEAERRAVEAHLSECTQCRASHHLESLLQRQLRHGVDAEPDSEGALDLTADLLIERASTPAMVAPEARARARGRPRRRWTRPRLRALLLGQTALIAVLALATLILYLPHSVSEYRTLTDAPNTTSSTGPVLRVVFAESTTAGSIRTVLSTIGGTISAGPSASNVYTVRLSDADGMPDRSPDDIAAWLRSQDGVLFAEAVASEPQTPR